jgi:transposase
MSVSASRCRAERRAVGPRKREEGHTTQEKLRLTVAARRETAAKLVEGGMSQRQAAEALGVGKGTIQRDLDRNGPQSGPERSTKAERRAQRELELASASEERHELEQIDEALGVRRWVWGARGASINETETASGHADRR